MKLTYRGVQYNYTPPQVDLEGANFDRIRTTPAHLTYRGVPYLQPQAIAGNSPEVDLAYRGVSYQVGTSVQPVAPTEAPAPVVASAGAPPAAMVNTTVAPSPAMPAEERARLLMMNHHRSVKLRQQSMLLRLAASVGVPTEEAAHYWTSIQGKVQPSFWATYDRSHISAS